MTFQTFFRAATASILTLSTTAMAQSDVQRVMDRMRSGPASSQASAQANPAAQVPPTGEREIGLAAMPVTIKKWIGQDKAFTISPNRVFVAGYNIGAIRKVVAVGKARGGLFATTSGATSKSELLADGIDEAMLVRIADAAMGDLLFQLKAAGFEVVPLASAMATAGSDKLKFNLPPYSASAMEVLVAGPTPTGVRGNFPLAKTQIGADWTPELALTLDAMVVMPNLTFDFAWAQGNRSLGFTASSQTGLRFGINRQYSNFRVSASKRKQFLEGDFIYALDADTSSEREFATITETERTDNRGVRMANALLGLGMMARSKQTGFAQIDQKAYEELALSAAKGWNAALVTNMKTRTGR